MKIKGCLIVATYVSEELLRKKIDTSETLEKNAAVQKDARLEKAVAAYPAMNVLID